MNKYMQSVFCTLLMIFITPQNVLAAGKPNLWQEVNKVDCLVKQEKSQLDRLDTTTASNFKDSRISQSKIFSKVDNIQTSLAAEFKNSSVSQSKTFSKVDKIQTSLSVGVQNIFQKLDNVQQVGSAFLITQDTIGSGNKCIISDPGHYIVSVPVIFEMGFGIHIKADNVTLDLNGHSINGIGAHPGAVCIYVDTASHVTIKNGTLVGAQGIVAHDVSTITLESIIACENQTSAYTIENSSNSVMRNCTAHKTVGNAIECKDSEHVVIERCLVQNGTESGIICLASSHVQIQENSLEGCQKDGISVSDDSDVVHVASNRMLGNNGTGLIDHGAISAIHVNNLSTANGTAYVGVVSVPFSSATSYWKNVRG